MEINNVEYFYGDDGEIGFIKCKYLWDLLSFGDKV